MRRSALAFIVLFAASLALLAGVAQAHAQYVTSDPHSDVILPTAPTRVTITLSERVQDQAGTPSIRVTDASGVREDAGSVNVSASDPRTFAVGLRPIGPGVYTVAWTAYSAVDGHFTAGSFAFGVQNADGSSPGPLPGATATDRPVSLVEVAGRFLSFAGLAIALGAALLAGFLWLPAGEDLGLAGRPSFAWGYRALLQWGWIGSLLLVGGTTALWVNALTLLPPADPAGLVGSPFLAATAARLGFGIALTVAIGVASRRSAAALSGTRPVELLAAIALGFAGIFAGTGGTHAAAGTWGFAGPVADAVHLLGVSLWVGGLLALFRIRPWLRERELAPVAQDVFIGFSDLAGWAVALVLGAGVVLSLILVGTWDALVGSVYGWIVLAKISLFAPMVAVGAWNRYRVLPASEDPEKLPDTVARLARNVRFEALLGAAVLALAAVLTAISPAISTAGGPDALRLTSTADGVRFDFQVTPFPSIPGFYTFELLLYNATDGSPYETATNATLHFTLNGTFVEDIPMTHLHGYHFFIDSSPRLSQPGDWGIDAEVLRTTGPLVHATFHIIVGPGG